MTNQSLFNTWRSKVPKYDERFKESTFKKLTNYGGGSEESKIDRGKHFSNAYELYIFAFFTGVHSNKRLKTEKRKTDFSHHIQYWGNKGSSLDREDFSDIQRYIFITLLARTNDLDLISLEKGIVDENEVVSELLLTMEEYTNGGLSLLEEAYENKGGDLNYDESFLNMYLTTLEDQGIIVK